MKVSGARVKEFAWAKCVKEKPQVGNLGPGGFG